MYDPIMPLHALSQYVLCSIHFTYILCAICACNMTSLRSAMSPALNPTLTILHNPSSHYTTLSILIILCAVCASNMTLLCWAMLPALILTLTILHNPSSHYATSPFTPLCKYQHSIILYISYSHNFTQFYILLCVLFHHLLFLIQLYPL